MASEQFENSEVVLWDVSNLHDFSHLVAQSWQALVC